MPEGSAPPSQIAQFRSDGITGATGLRIPFMTEAFSRGSGYPDLRLINQISEATPLREERPYVPYVGVRELHYSRPGLVSGLPFGNVGTGPIRGLYPAPPNFGVVSFFVASGATCYDQNGNARGALAGTDLVRFATSPSQVVCCAGGVAYLNDVTTSGVFTPIASPVLPPIVDVAYLAGRFIYQAAGSGVFWYSEINDAANVKGLNFATAEASSDNTVALAVLSDQLLIFGALSVETWDVTADPAAPFAPVQGRGYQRGCIARDAVAFVDNAIFWVGDNRVVYRAAGVPQSISSNSINDKLRQCTNIAGLTAWAATFEGHEFYVLNIPGVGTYAYDVSRVGTQAGAFGDSYQRGEWDEWQSYGRSLFRGRVAVSINDVTYVGDDTTNDVGIMTTGVYTDYGGPLVRVASAFIKIEEGTPRCTGLALHCAMGVGVPASPAPVVEMRYSDDQGRTFGKWRAAPLRAAGGYRHRAFWNRLGLMRGPGRLVEVRVSDPVNCVLSHLELNPARAAY